MAGAIASTQTRQPAGRVWEPWSSAQMLASSTATAQSERRLVTRTKKRVPRSGSFFLADDGVGILKLVSRVGKANESLIIKSYHRDPIVHVHVFVMLMLDVLKLQSFTVKIMKQHEVTSSSEDSRVIYLSELWSSIQSEETALLVPQVKFEDLDEGAELILRGERIGEYLRVLEISDAGNLIIQKTPIQSRRNVDALRAVISDERLTLLGSCGSMDQRYAAAVDIEPKILQCGKRSWILAAELNKVRERASSYIIGRIALIDSN